jgi:hypothetical protein
MLPPFSGPKNKLRKKSFYMLHAGFLLGIFFGPEDGGDVFLRNISRLSKEYTALLTFQ